VDHEDFSRDALVVLGHGTALNENSAAPVRQHAAELRRRNIFGAVQEAFWKQEPQIKRVLAEIQQLQNRASGSGTETLVHCSKPSGGDSPSPGGEGRGEGEISLAEARGSDQTIHGETSAPRIFIAPLFISEGYFAGQVIPRELGFAGQTRLKTNHSEIYYCSPVGTHDSMTTVILSRAEAVMKAFPFPRAPKPSETTLFIAGHGTEKNENSRKPIERQVDLIRARGIYADVHAIFMEEAPRIPDCYALARTKNLVVVPFFISDGLHAQEDIPVLLGETKKNVDQRLASGQPIWRNPTERNGKLVWYSPAVGTEPGMADVILERVREAAKGH